MIATTREFTTGTYVADSDGEQWWRSIAGCNCGCGGWEHYEGTYHGWKPVAQDEVPAEVRLAARLEQA